MAAGVRFVHASDLHLDAPFKGVDAAHPAVREALLASTYEALEAVVDACISEQVDFLVVAGDLYNSKDKSLRAQLAFQRATERLAEAGIATFLARGNHDPADGWSAGLAFPESVHVFAHDRVERVPFKRDGEVACTLYGRSFATSVVEENLARGFSREADDELVIGVLHANVGGREGHASYAPCSAEDLRAARMDFWALGHIHRPETVATEPAAAYPGSTQGLTPRETGVHGCLLVELDESGARMRPLPTCSVVWERSDIDISGIEGVQDLREALDDACDDARRIADGRPVVVRLHLTGRGQLHADLERDRFADDLLEDMREAQMARSPWVWVDRIKNRTDAALDIEAIRAGSDLAADLVGIADGLVADEDEAEAFVEAVLSPLRDRVDISLDLDARELVVRARDIVLDRFGAEDER